MSSSEDDRPVKEDHESIVESESLPIKGAIATNSSNPSAAVGTAVPKVAGYQDMVDALWPLMMKDVEGKMVQMEQELIKRHNIKMMNEMQEVVRQIKQAKTKNDETLRDYNKKIGDMARTLAELVDKFTSMRADIDEIKRQSLITKQQLGHRCDQVTDQVTQLKQAVFAAWQREKTEMQHAFSQSLRSDLSHVTSQIDARMKSHLADTAKIRNDLNKLTAVMNGQDPDKVIQIPPEFIPPTSLPPLQPVVAATPAPEPTTTPAPTAAAGPTSYAAAASAAASSVGIDLQVLTTKLATYIANQQAQSGASRPPTVDAQMLQQFMQTLPRNEQLQLQAMLQKQRAQSTAQRPPQPVVPPTPVQQPAAAAPTTPAPAVAAGMIQSLAQQLHNQVNQAQQRAATSPPQSVNCPYNSMFGWCKFGDRCRYLHQQSGKEPLRNLSQAVIQTLQNQLATGATELTTQTLMGALAGVAARQTTPAPAPDANQDLLLEKQIQAQQEAVKIGLAKAKMMPCAFISIGRCAYGDKCAYSHASAAAAAPVADTAAAAAAAAWGKTGLQQASWGGVGLLPSAEPSADIVDGEDDTSYDQWNADTFDDGAAGNPPPGL
jgi:hypothetical protein